MAHPFARREAAPMLESVWGPDLASVVATLVIKQPGLARRLVLAPRRTVHALGVYIHHAVSVQQDHEHIAQDVAEQDARVLLGRAIANLHPRLYRTLDRVGPVVLSPEFYTRLNTVMHGPAGDLLLETDEIADHHLGMAVEIIADPVLLAARRAIESRSDLQRIQDSLLFLRTTGLASDIERLPPGSGWRAVLRRLSSDLGRARAPTNGFDLPSGWRHIESVVELWRIGVALGNCVASLTAGGERYISDT